MSKQQDRLSGIECIPLAGRIGAEILGAVLSGELSADKVDAIRAALVEYKVIFFRDQDSFDDEKQEAFARLMGPPAPHPTLPTSEGANYLIDVAVREAVAASTWHTDVTFVPAIPDLSILRCITAAKLGGNTMWANCASAYESLPVHLRQFVDQLWAVHSNGMDYEYHHPNADRSQFAGAREAYSRTIYDTEHPVVRVHPESGERVLLAGGSVKRLVGFNITDSHRILDILQDAITRCENTVRWAWRDHDVAIWDNRATQHRVIADFGDQPRMMRRATVGSSVPVSVDGQSSRALLP